MNKNTIKLDVTLNEAKKIFEALGKLPFEEVYELIGKLNEQVNAGYTPPAVEEEEQSKKSKQVHLKRNQGQ